MIKLLPQIYSLQMRMPVVNTHRFQLTLILNVIIVQRVENLDIQTQ